MDEIKKIFKIKTERASFKTPERQSIEATEDYATKKVVNTQEGTVEKVPINNSDIANKKYVDDEIATIPDPPYLYDKIIAADGSGDYTSIVTATATEGTYTTFFIKSGTYTLTENIVLKTGQQLIGESMKSVIIDQNNTVYKIYVSAMHNVVLKRFSLINGRNTSEQLDIRYSNNCIVEEVYMDSGVTGGLGSYISGLMIEYCDNTYINDIHIKGYLYNYKFEYSTHTRVSNIYSESAQLYGIRFRNCSYTVITNFVSYYDGSAVYFRDSSYAVITNVIVEFAIYGFYFYSTSSNNHNTITNFQGTCYTSFAYFGSSNNDYNTFIGVDLDVDVTLKGEYNKMIGCSVGNVTVYAGAVGTAITGSKFGTLTDNGTGTAISGCDYTGILNTLNQNQPVVLTGTNPQLTIQESTTEFLRVGVGETAGKAIIGWDDSDTLIFGVYSSPTDTTITTRASISNAGLFTMTDVAATNISVGGLFTTGKFMTFVVNDTTPSVSKSNNYLTANTGATSITTFDNGVEGQRIIILFGDDNTTLVDSASLNLAGSADWTPRVDDVIELIYYDAWYEVSRSEN